ncbi:mitochondrial carrier [Zopfochytrium polystomum]|nr:mitochondrial carrier [Zopfochytrium polystomum]
MWELAKGPEVPFGEDEYESLPANSPLHVNLMAGALAGITEHTVMFPFDSIKTRMQAVTARGATPIYTSMSQSISRIATSEGALALWRGVNSVVLGAGPAHALHFATYEHCKVLFGATSDKASEGIVLGSAAAGAVATIAADGVMNPFDVIKQRMQLNPYRYRSVISCARHILHREGFRAFYLSYPTTLSLSIPFHSIHFSTYEHLRATLNPSGAYSPVTHIISGAVAGAVASTATTPLDVVKTMLQTRGVACDREVQIVRGFKDAARLIKRRYGLKGFFRGWAPRVVTHMPATAVSWTTYEFVKNFVLSQ